ncbi:MAG: radical SAM family heme chaperone HemW [Gammaproteobacteria bacterium]|nr:radical SAM family heme chaperone HemW [Gammaproteobacteria bacterium]
MLEKPPLSLYIHVPWCVRKCPYCDFNSHESNKPLPEKEYIAALYSDFLYEFSKLPDQEIELQSIFIGGGTPSLLTGDSYRFLLDSIKSHLHFSNDIEITLEANPSSSDIRHFSAYREAGVNRLSLGIQSFDDKKLKKLGRIHDKEQSVDAIKIAKQAGFRNLNLDLMHGLPEQNTEEALKDLQLAIDTKPNHISWYQLTIEPNTFFYSHTPVLPSEKKLIAIQENGSALLEANGYTQYEISAFATDDKNSLHNCNYWSFGDYIGIGAGAHGKLTSVNEQKIIRTRKVRQPDEYIKRAKNRDAEIKEVSTEERALEFLMNALRFKAGFSKELFEKRTGIPFIDISHKVLTQIEKGLMYRKITEKGEFYATTQKGYRFLNSVLEEFL